MRVNRSVKPTGMKLDLANTSSTDLDGFLSNPELHGALGRCLRFVRCFPPDGVFLPTTFVAPIDARNYAWPGLSVL
jgi:hypothetical protein